MISLRHVLLLTQVEAFWFGVACICAAIYLAIVMLCWLDMLLRWTFRWCQAHLGQPGKVVNIEERRRQLTMAAVQTDLMSRLK